MSSLATVTFPWARPILLLTALLVLPQLVLPYIYTIYLPNQFLVLHVLLEMLSIFIAFTIFNMIWQLYDGLDKANGLFLVIVGMGFGAIGLIDTLHTLCYDGMPDFLLISSPENATFFWLLERYITGIGFFIAILWPNNLKSDLRRLRNRFLLANLALVGVASLFHIYFANLIPPLQDSNGPTELKIQLEYVATAIYLLNLILLWCKRHVLGENTYRQITYFFVISIFAGFSFTQYSNIYDSYNLLGHVYKSISFWYLYKAVYLSGVINRVYTMSEIGEMSEELLKDTVSLEKVLDIQMSRLCKLLPQTERAVVVLKESVDCFRIAYSWGRYTYYFPVGMEIKYKDIDKKISHKTTLFTDPQQFRNSLDNTEHAGKLNEIFKYAKQLLYLPLITPQCGFSGWILLYSFSTYKPFRNSDMEKAIIFQRFCSLAIIQAKSQDLINKLSYQDSLTGLPNRRAFFDELAKTKYDADKHGIPFTVVYLDMNDLKIINDVFGHIAGDLALKTVGQNLRTHSRTCDLPVRLGGDEFAILYRHMDSIQGNELIEQLKESSHAIPLPGFNHAIVMAVGGACYPTDSTDIDILLKIADDRMYEHKCLVKGANNTRRVHV